MRILAILLASLLISTPLLAQGQRTPVVLELYTSQGCSSCPPADALLAELADRPGVIGLALHVDYWDYLGWKDSFGSAAHTARQRAYAKAARKRSIYTPQMIVQGQDRLVGHKAGEIRASIAAHQLRPATVSIEIARADGTLRIALAPLAPDIGPVDLHVVQFIREQGVAIKAGENAGHQISYTNIVTDWSTVARWDGRAATEVAVKGVGSGPVAVIVQHERLGAILTSARLP